MFILLFQLLVLSEILIISEFDEDVADEDIENKGVDSKEQKKLLLNDVTIVNSMVAGIEENNADQPDQLNSHQSSQHFCFSISEREFVFTV